MNAIARAELLQKVRLLIGEHCNAFIFIACVDMDECDNEECIIHDYDGGRAHALGLMEVVRGVLMGELNVRTIEDAPTPDPDPDPDEDDNDLD